MSEAIVKAMSDQVSSQETIELTLDSGIEVVFPQPGKIQFRARTYRQDGSEILKGT